MRIIAGKYRGRKIETGDSRPTMSRVRESIFNILSHGDFSNFLPESRILDLFCGSGALALEALSRGAKHATMVDKNTKIAALNIEKLNLSEVTLLNKDINDLPYPIAPCNLVFIDPPYKQHFLIAKALKELCIKKWLALDALLILELHKNTDVPPLAQHYKLLDTRIYGICKVAFISYIGGPEESDNSGFT